MRNLIDEVIWRCSSLDKILVLWFGEPNANLSSLQEMANQKSLTNIKKNFHIKLMRLKQINTVFYPFDELFESTESILLLRESKSLLNDLTSKRIEQAFLAWTNKPHDLIKITRDAYFYHSIFNQIYFSHVFSTVKSNMNFNNELFTMSSMILNLTKNSVK
jgi:hypothetical protein